MKELTDHLREIITLYADYDMASNTYYNKQGFDDAKRQQLEARLITFFSQFLTQDGTDTNQLERWHKKLRFEFHTDRYLNASVEANWLEYTLSNGALNGACFKLIDDCAETIKNPTSHGSAMDSDYTSIHNIDELIDVLFQKREKATTLTQRALIDSTITLLQAMMTYRQTVKRMGPYWPVIIAHLTPYITSGFGIGLFLSELALLFAVAYSLSKGGKWLEQSSGAHWRYIGHQMNRFSQTISQSALILMAYFVKINFLAINKIYYFGIETCVTIYQALTSVPTRSTKPNVILSMANSDQAEENNTHNMLVLAPQHLLGGKQFQTIELKFIVLGLEQWQIRQQKQYFSTWRTGHQKALVIEQFIDKLIDIDKCAIDLDTKLIQAGEGLSKLVKNNQINVKGSHAANAINMAECFYTSLIKKEQELESADEEDVVFINSGLLF